MGETIIHLNFQTSDVKITNIDTETVLSVKEINTKIITAGKKIYRFIWKEHHIENSASPHPFEFNTNFKVPIQQSKANPNAKKKINPNVKFLNKYEK